MLRGYSTVIRRICESTFLLASSASVPTFFSLARPLTGCIQFRYHPNRSFHSFFVCLTPTQTVWRKGRESIALNAAFTKTAFKYVLMLAAGYNGADNLVIYVWAVVPSEIYATWVWFCELLNRALGSVNLSYTTLIR